MALSSYAELKTSIGGWLNRTDLTDQIPDFITLAEGQINRRLRVRHMAARATAAISDQYSAVPDDFGGVLSFDLNTNPVQPLKYLSPQEFTRKRSETPGTGEPRYFTILGPEFGFYPTPDASYTAELSYWTRLVPLTVTNTSNWLLAAYPDAYLYGALTQSAPYLMDDSRLGTWGSLFETALADIERDDSKSRPAMALNTRRTF